MTKIVKLNGEQLNNVIMECVQEVMRENPEMVDEGFIDNAVQGVKSFFGNGAAGANNAQNQTLRSNGNGGLNLKKRWNAAKTNYNMTKENDKIDTVINYLQDLVEKGQVKPEMTVAQLVGGKMNNNKFGTLTAMRNNRTARASKAMNDIYREEE